MDVLSWALLMKFAWLRVEWESLDLAYIHDLLR